VLDQDQKVNIIKNILNIQQDHKNNTDSNIIQGNSNKSKSKVGFIKEGYSQIHGINPIDRYNFVIDRYNEEFNQVRNIRLSKIPAYKIIKRLYDLYIWISRMIMGVFLVLTYYLYKYKYKRRNLTRYRAGLYAYRKYLIQEDDYFKYQSPIEAHKGKSSYAILLTGIVLLCISLYLIVIFFLVMFLPNVIFTIYLFISLIIHKCNKSKLNDIFQNMIYESKLDENGQLNDYIIIDSATIKYYHLFSYYDKLLKLYETREKSKPQCFMIYGDLFVREYNVLVSSFIRQLLSVLGFCIIGYMYYL
jgi:hypothetical protein